MSARILMNGRCYTVDYAVVAELALFGREYKVLYWTLQGE